MVVAFLGILLGIPSALDLKFLANQDWVWGVGLILSDALLHFQLLGMVLIDSVQK